MYSLTVSITKIEKKLIRCLLVALGLIIAWPEPAAAQARNSTPRVIPSGASTNTVTRPDEKVRENLKT